MARRLKKSLAIELRKSGKTYNEIIEALVVPKGTLSDWLSDYPLTSRQIEALSRNIKRRRIISTEKTIAVKYRKKQARLKKIYEDQVKELLPLTKREFYLAGLFLYWGEGAKMSTGSISLNNTDPNFGSFI